MTTQGNLFGGARLQMTESIQLTIDSLKAHGAKHDVWAIAWSGGKDSTALLTLAIWLVLSGRVQRPKRIVVLYADTRMEIPPLWHAAKTIRDELAVAAEELAVHGVAVDVRVVMAALDHRFWVYMLGRGVPPPTNTFRWCTEKLKVIPMEAEAEAIARAAGGRALILTGLRKGESAVRDARIAVACGRDDGECGQGLFQLSLSDEHCDKLAPILHWRTCHVWQWLKTWAPLVEYGDWSTSLIADAYGGEQAEDLAARTGCMDCNLVEEDRALRICAGLDGWTHLSLIAGRLKEIYRELRLPARRLRQPGGEKRKDGSLATNQQRLGPLTLETRLWALGEVLSIQHAVNEAAALTARPGVDLINAEEEARIRELIAVKTWPDGWTGAEPTGDVMLDKMFADGTAQPLLPMFGKE